MDGNVVCFVDSVIVRGGRHYIVLRGFFLYKALE